MARPTDEDRAKVKAALGELGEITGAVERVARLLADEREEAVVWGQVVVEQRIITLDSVKYSAPITVKRRKVKGKPTTTVTLEAAQAHSHAIALQLIDANAMGPEAAGFLRAQIAETAEVLHPAFGVSRKTFYRWSKGIDPMPRAAWLILARIIRERDEGGDTMLRLLLEPL